MRKEEKKNKPTATKLLLPHPLQVVLSLAHEGLQQWAKKTRLKTIVQDDRVSLADSQGVEELIKQLVEIDIVMVLGRKPLDINTKLVHKALRLPYIDNQEATKTYMVVDEGTVHILPTKCAYHGKDY